MDEIALHPGSSVDEDVSMQKWITLAGTMGERTRRGVKYFLALGV